MTHERWQQVDQLLEAALARPSGERAAFLAEACADDAALRQEVESLLRFHEEEDDFLEALPAALAAEVVAGSDEWSGRRFGHYQIERRLGQGGMGVVYLARDTRLGRPVALKLLQPRFTQDPERVRRFRREARAASNLNHPNILTIYEVGQAAPEEGGAHFIAAEFVAGETLRARIARGTRPDEALDWAIQIAAALAAAHRRGVVHRDIKPENVMARPDGLVKVLDFGLAKDCAGRFQTAEELRLALKKLKREGAAPGDSSMPEFNRFARRLDHAGADTIVDTAKTPARATSGASFLFSRLVRSPLRKAVALAALALAGAVFGWQWLAPRGAPVHSIAVLPFANAVTDPQMEYLSDGITESLTRNLSQLPELRVMARGTVFTYKGREADPRQVGAALNVRAVVTGRVEQRGDRLIVDVELADARDGARIWGERYHRPSSDIFTVQEEIVRAVARQLHLNLSGAEQQRLAKRYTGNTTAYRLYLQGRYP